MTERPTRPQPPTAVSDSEARRIARLDDLPALMARAAAMRDAGFGDSVTFSRKVFIPLTQLCRDSCHYCTFAHPPRKGESAYMSLDQVLAVARAGAAAGCDEALFTLGDKPELRYRAAREALAALGHDSTLSYLAAAAEAVRSETGLLPHINAGVMGEDDIRRLRGVAVSQGLMLETISDRLSARGGPHFGSPDKLPAARLATIEAAGRAAVPFTTGLLIGIGETRTERVEALLAIRELHMRHGHVQEIIIQNFRAKPGTRMQDFPEPSLAEQQWTIAMARLIFGPDMPVQSPPNLRAGDLGALLAAGLNDWGGVSPVTPDHVNPERPWPEIAALAEQTQAAGKDLAPRLAVYPGHLAQAERWLDPALLPAVLARADAGGLAQETGWRVGLDTPAPQTAPTAAPAVLPGRLAPVLDRLTGSAAPRESDLVTLFEARGSRAAAVAEAADGLRRALVGDTVTYVVNRNINYTNVCGYRCQFCAFSKGRLAENLRGRPYDLDLDEIRRRSREAWERGATEVCLQGGIHPDYTGDTYLAILAAVREAVPGMHVHAFSALEIAQGAATLDLPLAEYLARLRDAGLGTLPGTAAEILDDPVRAILCADKLDTDAWLKVHRTAHAAGLRSTATMMFGHIDAYPNWARHLLRLRDLQAETGGFTEFVPLPFVHMEAPIYRKGRSRQGPSYREAVLVHAVARLAFGAVLPNIQTSWVKMGDAGVRAALAAGVNDLGGTLMNESISRAAGTAHGQEMPPERMERLIAGLGRRPQQRTTLYGTPPAAQVAAGRTPAPLAPVLEQAAGKHARIGGHAQALRRRQSAG